VNFVSTSAIDSATAAINVAGNQRMFAPISQRRSRHSEPSTHHSALRAPHSALA
jgi:hypothetical protein